MALILQNNVPLAPYTTFKIGGPAKFFVDIKKLGQVIGALKFAKENKLKILFLSGGSNLLIPDEGFNGLVIKFSNDICGVKDTKLVCEAGATMEQAVNLAIEHSLQGLEWAGGLPGTVGGAVRGNAGAFGGETKDSIESVLAIRLWRKGSEGRSFSQQECKFGYRDSIFKHEQWAIELVAFRLKPGNKSEIERIANDHVQYRKDRHPLEYGNAGSIFKNTPVASLPKELVEKWQSVVKTDPFPIVPTAAIIAAAGLGGFTIGKAQVSTKHTNYIVNVGGATAQNVKDLIAHVKKTVKEKFGIDLEVEVQIL